MKRVCLLKLLLLFICQILSIRGNPDPLTALLICDGPVYYHPNTDKQIGYQQTLPTYPTNKQDHPNIPDCHNCHPNTPDCHNCHPNNPGCHPYHPNCQSNPPEFQTVPGHQHLPNGRLSCPVECGNQYPECNCGCKTTNSLPINTACQQYCPGFCQQSPEYQYSPNVYNQICSPDGECSTEALKPKKIHYSKVVDGDLISFTYDIGQEGDAKCGCRSKLA